VDVSTCTTYDFNAFNASFIQEIKKRNMMTAVRAIPTTEVQKISSKSDTSLG
jgi:hypothetical protein